MTPHINAKKDDIAKVVLMPGDPFRAKFIAENYLQKVKKVNEIRGMLAYTGYYNGKKITIMASGMGHPSIGIYSYELYKFYDVQSIIRIGSCATCNKNVDLGDIVLWETVETDSNYYKNFFGNEKKALNGSKRLISFFKELNCENSHIGKCFSSDNFYRTEKNMDKFIKHLVKKNFLAKEMESFSLYTNAEAFNKEALTIATVVGSYLTMKGISAKEREKGLTKMINISLELAFKA